MSAIPLKKGTNGLATNYNATFSKKRYEVGTMEFKYTRALADNVALRLGFGSALNVHAFNPNLDLNVNIPSKEGDLLQAMFALGLGCVFYDNGDIGSAGGGPGLVVSYHYGDPNSAAFVAYFGTRQMTAYPDWYYFSMFELGLGARTLRFEWLVSGGYLGEIWKSNGQMDADSFFSIGTSLNFFF